MALQKNIASAPSITVWSVGVVIKLGATKKKLHVLHSDSLLLE